MLEPSGVGGSVDGSFDQHWAMKKATIQRREGLLEPSQTKSDAHQREGLGTGNGLIFFAELSGRVRCL